MGRQDRDVVPELPEPFEETGVLCLQFGVAQGQNLDLGGVGGHGVLQLPDLGSVLAAKLTLRSVHRCGTGRGSRRGKHGRALSDDLGGAGEFHGAVGDPVHAQLAAGNVHGVGRGGRGDAVALDSCGDGCAGPGSAGPGLADAVAGLRHS